MVYSVELTKVAEDDYDQLQARAQHFLDSAGERHPAVRTFKVVQNAIDNILPLNPCNPNRALAGTLSFLYLLPLGRVSLSYVVNEAKPAVIVLTISRAVKNDAVRDWLTTGIESGELGPVLESLGIHSYLMKMEVNSRYPH